MITAAAIDYNFFVQVDDDKKKNTRLKTEPLNNSYSWIETIKEGEWSWRTSSLIVFVVVEGGIEVY